MQFILQPKGSIQITGNAEIQTNTEGAIEAFLSLRSHRVEMIILRRKMSRSTVVVYFHWNLFFPIIRLLGNTNGRPYLSVVTNKRHHATTVLDITQVLLVGGGGG